MKEEEIKAAKAEEKLQVLAYVNIICFIAKKEMTFIFLFKDFHYYFTLESSN